jgi:hypothetical protein
LFRTATVDPEHPGKRYNTDGTHAFCAHPDTKVMGNEEQDIVWHGFPIEWRMVPTTVQRAWVKEGRIARLRLRG